MVAHEEVFVLIMVFPTKQYLLIGSHNIRKTGILLLRKSEGDHLKWDVNQRKSQKR